MTQVLVTGGAGAIGSHLVARLVQGGYQVSVIDDLSSGHKELLPDSVNFTQGSINDEAALAQAFSVKPRWVFHLAALFANQQSMDRPVHDLTVNGIGTLNVLRFASENKVEKFLYTSSSCVYGVQQQVMKESDGLSHLDTPYAATKMLGEHYCRIWAKNHGLPTVVMRLFNSYGPHEFPGKYRNVIPNFFALALNHQPLPILGTGKETRDFTFVSDVVDGMLVSMSADTGDYEVFNLGNGVGTSIQVLAEAINGLTGNSAGFTFSPRRSWDHVEHRSADISKAKQGLGYEPKIKLLQGLSETFNWFTDNNVK